MAEEQGSNTDNPLLRGLFGVLQAGVQQHLDTASIWQSLRQAAGTWQFQAQGEQQPYDPVALEQAGREILSAQGINGATVSSFRGVSGQWLAAKQRLAGLDGSQQITSREVFTPPWSRTDSPVTPSRYRIRTQWQITPSAGDVYTVWKSDEVTAPLTNVDDALSSVLAPTTGSPKVITSLGDTLPERVDYAIEQV